MRGKKNRGGKVFNPKPNPLRVDEYDLENNFRKVRSYVKNAGRVTRAITEQENRVEDQNSLANPIQSPLTGPTSTDSWGQFYHLDDKITDFQFQNESAHAQLRQELSNKIDKLDSSVHAALDTKLSIKWYRWTVVAIVAIVTLIYVLSYSKVLSTQEDHSEEIKSISVHMEGTDKKLENIERNILDIKEEIKKTSPIMKKSK